MTVHHQSDKVITSAAWKMQYDHLFRTTPRKGRASKVQIKRLRAQAKQLTYALYQ